MILAGVLTYCYKSDLTPFANQGEIEIALKVGVKTTATVKNAFRKDMQIVSDEVLTKIMETIK